MHSAWGCASQTPCEGWALIWVNFDPIQEVGPKEHVGVGDHVVLSLTLPTTFSLPVNIHLFAIKCTYLICVYHSLTKERSLMKECPFMKRYANWPRVSTASQLKGSDPSISVCTSIYAKLPCSNLLWSFLPQICTALEAVLLKLHAPGWGLIWVNFDPIQEVGPKEHVGVGGHVVLSLTLPTTFSFTCQYSSVCHQVCLFNMCIP